MSSSFDQYDASFFDLESVEQIAIIRINRPSLSEEDNVELLGQELNGVIDQFGFQRIVLSLLGVEWVTSSILGKLIHLHRSLKRSQGELVICDVSPNVNDVLQTSRLDTYFQIQATVADALAALQNSN